MAGRLWVATLTAANRSACGATTSRSAAVHSSGVLGPSRKYQSSSTISSRPSASSSPDSSATSAVSARGSQRSRVVPWPCCSSWWEIHAAQGRVKPA